MAGLDGRPLSLRLLVAILSCAVHLWATTEVTAEVIWPSYETPEAKPDFDEMLPGELEPIEARLPVQVRVSPHPANFDPTLYYGGVTVDTGLGPLRSTRVYIRSSRWELETLGESKGRAQIIPVRLGSVLGKALEAPFGQLFPAGKKDRRQDQPLTTSRPMAWNVKYRFTIEALKVQGHQREGLRLQLGLEIYDQEGAAVTNCECSAESRAGTNFWSPVSLIETLTQESVAVALKRCASLLRQSADLRKRLDRLEVETSGPAGLTLQMGFDDSAGILPNGRLDAGEKARLKVRVRNEGPGKAFGLELRLVAEEATLAAPPSMQLGDLAVGAQLEREVEILASPSLSRKRLLIRAEVLESRGYAARPLELEISAAELTPSGLEIYDFVFNDATAPAIGDGDGRPGAGETLEAVVRLRNTGPGEARPVQMSLLNPPPSVTLVRAPEPIVSLPAGTATEARFLLTLSRTGLEPSLELSFEAVDGRGRDAGAVSSSRRWNTVARRPLLRLGLRMADGNSQGSAGNGDGIASNGETLELGLTLKNEGTLDARSARLSVSSNVPGLTLQPSSTPIGALPVGATSRNQWVVMKLPREVALPATATQVPVIIRIAQEGFPEERVEISLPYRGTEPRLQLVVPEGLILEQGATLETSFEITNQGDLAAEELEVIVESSVPGVELLDESGLPQRKLEFSVGTLTPGGIRKLRARLSARTGAPAGSASLVLATRQKDFPGPKAKVQMTAGAQAPLVVRSTVELEAPSPAPGRKQATPPPTISFLPYQSGDRLAQEAIVFRFEVQHDAQLADVRPELNGRPLPLSGSAAETSRAGAWNSSTYKLPVELLPGENRFEVTAITADGQRGVRPLTLIREEKVGRLFVVAIGVSSYQDTALSPLRFAHLDAEAVAAYFRTTLDLPADQVLVRTTERATLQEVKSILGTKLPRLATAAEDTVILYLAGHGVSEPAVGGLDPDGIARYFLPTDAALSDLYSTALPREELEDILRRYRAERVAVVLDSCFSGASATRGRTLFDRSHATRDSLTDEFLARLANAGKGRAILAASEPNEVATENSLLRHGVFTYYLLEGLRGAADTSGDGVIDLDEIYRYVADHVTEATDGRQRPMRRYPVLLGQILIGRAIAPR